VDSIFSPATGLVPDSPGISNQWRDQDYSKSKDHRLKVVANTNAETTDYHSPEEPRTARFSSDVFVKVNGTWVSFV
jgi:hypothetical protein